MRKPVLNERTHSISFFTLVVKSVNKVFINSHMFFILDSLRHISFNKKNPWKSGDLRSPVENKLYHLEFSIGRSLTIIPEAISATLMAKNRSSHPEVFCKKDVLRNFPKFTRKHLCQSPFFNKVADLRPACNFIKKETVAQVSRVSKKDYIQLLDYILCYMF